MAEEPQQESIRCWIRLGGHEVELAPGQSVIGRHDSCHVVLDDPLASRRHAILHFDGRTLSVEDLGSINGVIVNDSLISKTEQLKHGDVVTLGEQRIIVHLGQNSSDAPARARVGAETLAGIVVAAPGSSEESTVIREGEALETLAYVAEKLLALGSGAEAERILSKALISLRNHTASGGAIESETLQTAGVFAVRLAVATDTGEWIDFVFDLYAAAGRVMPGSVVDPLYTAVRSVNSVRVDPLRSYLAELTRLQPQLGPSDRFLLRRIEGLERLILLRPNR